MNKINSYYYNKKFLDIEKKNHLKNSWFIAGHKCEFEKTLDFKTFEIFGHPIVLYNFKNGLKAFSNVCLHRGSIIKKKEFGNEKFFCPYHFWSYSEDGIVKNIPLKEKCFKEKKKIKNLILNEWKIETCGNLIFISSNLNQKNLKSFLGKDYKRIEKLSLKIKKKISSTNWIWNSNWKLCIENSIDEYHAIFVHQTTFKNILKQEPNYSYSKNIMSMEMPLKEDYVKKLKQFSKKFSKHYSHILIYPLSTVASTMEHSFYIQRYTPIDVNKTLVSSDIYLAEFEKNMTKKALNYFELLLKKFNDQVFKEDKLICENNHRGLKFLDTNTIIGNYEERIKFFRNKNIKLLK